MLGYYLDQKNLMQNFAMNTLKKHPNWALIMVSGSKLEIKLKPAFIVPLSKKNKVYKNMLLCFYIVDIIESVYKSIKGIRYDCEF